MTYTGSSKEIAYEPFSQLANHYAKFMDNNPFYKYLERPTMLEMLGSVQGKKILDVGCGTGWHTKYFIENGADVVSIDISPEMVQRAKMRIGDRTDRIQIGNIEETLPFVQEGSIHLVYASLVLHFMKEWHLSLAEIRRVLVPGGELIFSICHPTFTDYSRSENRRYNQVEIVEEIISGVSTKRYRNTLSTIMNSLAQAGFTLLEMREPEPIPEMLKHTDKWLYEYLIEHPYFLCIKVRKS
ncbi:methyltransferase domain-containing protein (plasmid) [Brevibacillus halotolerans]|nr:methyltransferase domain-containing protein [Brevibacillus halotolerans]